MLYLLPDLLWLFSLLGEFDYSVWTSDYLLNPMLLAMMDQLCCYSFLIVIFSVSLCSILLFRVFWYPRLTLPDPPHIRMRAHISCFSHASQWSIMSTKHITSQCAWVSPSCSRVSATVGSSLWIQLSWLVIPFDRVCRSAAVLLPYAWVVWRCPISLHL